MILVQDFAENLFLFKAIASCFQTKIPLFTVPTYFRYILPIPISSLFYQNTLKSYLTQYLL